MAKDRTTMRAKKRAVLGHLIQSVRGAVLEYNRMASIAGLPAVEVSIRSSGGRR